MNIYVLFVTFSLNCTGISEGRTILFLKDRNMAVHLSLEYGQQRQIDCQCLAEGSSTIAGARCQQAVEQPQSQLQRGNRAGLCPSAS